MIRAWVTGATGGLGRSVVTRLLAAGFEVMALGRNAQIGAELTDEGAHFEAVDLTQLSEDDWLMRLGTGDIIFHCAALSSPWGKHNDFYQANVLVTQNLVVAATRAKILRFIHVSTPSIYFNFTECLNISEDMPLPKPVNAYAATKRLAESHVQNAAQQGLKCVVIRPRALFGEHDTVLVPRILRAYKNAKMPLIENGTALIDLTYIGNVAHAMYLAATQNLDFSDNKAKIYNITNDEPIRLKDVLNKLFTALDLPVVYKNIPWKLIKPVSHLLENIAKLTQREPMLTPYSAGILAFSQTLDISRAKQELGYAPIHSVDEGIERYVAWLNQNNIQKIK